MDVLLDDQVRHTQMYFARPHRVIESYGRRAPSDVFAEIDDALARGRWVAGWIGYEFGAALEPRLAHTVNAGVPVLRLGVFDAPSDIPPVECLYTAEPPSLSLEPAWSEADYLRRFEAVQRYLGAGDAYQINLTFPLNGVAPSGVETHHIYAAFRRRQPGRYGALIRDPGGPDVASFSPELFFAREGRSMRMRPMKGTLPLSGEPEAMRLDPKSRAENLMIVDLLRNDLSRLCEPGSVRVPELFALEAYPTLHQMTSEVTGRLREDVSWETIFRALFPCGSVTGAPKVRAMEIIHELEAGPRWPYCGAIGFIAPDGRACFSVAIRTLIQMGQRIRYSVGSGVVRDSDGESEYRECLLKADLLKAEPERAIETLRLEPDGHAARLARHAARFKAARPQGGLEALVGALDVDGVSRVRVSAASGRAPRAEAAPLLALTEPLSIALSRYPLSDAVQTTAFKTSRRDFYDGERARAAARCGADEVVFRGEDGRMREGSFTSLFVQSGRTLLTPAGPGLLPGVLRAELLDAGVAREAPLRWDDLLEADALFVGNSLRGLMRARIIAQEPV